MEPALSPISTEKALSSHPAFASSSLFHSAIKGLFCLMAALGVSVALFLFMQKLVNQPIPTLPDVEFSGFVELFKPPQNMQEDTTPPQPEQQIAEPEPQQHSVNMLTQAQSDMTLPENFALNTNNLFTGVAAGVSANNVQIAQELLDDFGEDTQQGFTEITPFATRRPNIPDIAYENQLNGWVLVIFNVSSTGKPHSIKVLDASPKGIFEEEVIKAIKHWRYNLKGISRNGQDRVLTQKIELNWQNYPQNLAYEE